MPKIKMDTTVNEIARIVIKEMNVKNIRFKYTGGNRGWKGDVPVVRLDTKKVRKLGWKPKLTSRKAVKQATRENLYLCR